MYRREWGGELPALQMCGVRLLPSVRRMVQQAHGLHRDVLPPLRAVLIVRATHAAQVRAVVSRQVLRARWRRVRRLCRVWPSAAPAAHHLSTAATAAALAAAASFATAASYPSFAESSAVCEVRRGPRRRGHRGHLLCGYAPFDDTIINQHDGVVVFFFRRRGCD